MWKGDKGREGGLKCERFRVQSSRLGIQAWGFRVQDEGVRAEGLGSKGLRLRVQH